MSGYSEFEQGQTLGREQERERLAAYFHRRLAPDLLALAFSIEGVRAELEAQDHPSAPKLQELLNRLTEMIKPMREEILKETATPDQNYPLEASKRRLIRNRENHISAADRTCFGRCCWAAVPALKKRTTGSAGGDSR